MGVICAREQVRWDMGSEERGWVALGGREVCCGVGSGLGTTLGERDGALSVWTWGSFVGVEEGVGVGS